MGKISDALDRIDSFEETGIIYPQPQKERTEESISPTAESTIAIEKYEDKANVNGRWDDRLLEAVHNSPKMAEAFATLSSTILHPPDGRKSPKSIMVSSSNANEGKSFIAANLGVSLAKSFNQPCLLVDGDLGNTTLAKGFGVNPEVGLVDYLKDQEDLSGLIVETSVSNLFVLPGGIISDKPSELLSSGRIDEFFKDITSRYDDHIIIFDTSHMLLETEFVAFAGQVDAIILAIRQGRSTKAEVQRFIDTVGEEKIFGIVFNDVPSLN